MAGDGKIGGFSGQWGEGTNIDKKIRLLQSEGVVFDSQTGKIDKSCMLSSIPVAASGDENEGPKKRSTKRQKEDSKSASKHSTRSMAKKQNNANTSIDIETESSSVPSPAPTDVELRETVLQMIDERATGKTC